MPPATKFKAFGLVSHGAANGRLEFVLSQKKKGSPGYGDPNTQKRRILASFHSTKKK